MSTTFDLSTLGLSAGTHSITVKARASGYEDSAESNAVSYVVGGVTQVKGTYKLNSSENTGVTTPFHQDVPFISNGIEYHSITTTQNPVTIKYGDTLVYSNSKWADEAYRQITIIGEPYISTTVAEWLNAGGCFVAGTPVLMADGSTKAIETLVEGDSVLTYNEQLKIYDTGLIQKLIIVPTYRISRIGFEDGSYVEITDRHPLYIDGVWKTLVKGGLYPDIELGDRVLSTNGNSVRITSIEDITLDEPINTYNVEVEGEHNYFVGEAEILAHNDGSR